MDVAGQRGSVGEDRSSGANQWLRHIAAGLASIVLGRRRMRQRTPRWTGRRTRPGMMLWMAGSDESEKRLRKNPGRRASFQDRDTSVVDTDTRTQGGGPTASVAVAVISDA